MEKWPSGARLTVVVWTGGLDDIDGVGWFFLSYFFVFSKASDAAANHDQIIPVCIIATIAGSALAYTFAWLSRCGVWPGVAFV